MVNNPYRGKFIVIEGIDGSGSTTQVARVHEFLRSKKYKSHITKEPTNYLIGGLIRSWLTGDWSSSPVALQLLFTADRAHHLEKEVLPLLQKGVYVVSDRYYFSTIAYGAVDIPDVSWLYEINKHFIRPDLTVYLRVGAEEAMVRMSAERNSLELFEKEQQLKKVIDQYERVVREDSYVRVIDGERSENKVFGDLKRILEDALVL